MLSNLFNLPNLFMKVPLIKNLFYAIILIFATAAIFAQDNNAQNNKSKLPNGYGGVTLGMTLDNAKDALKKNSDFGYRGDRDVSLTPGDEHTLIECDPQKTMANPFLQRCYFQFSSDTLYIITINVSGDKMDYFSMFDTLCNKYGNPNSLNPNCATWENDSVKMTLERPLCLKYIDKSVFDDLQEKSLVEKSGKEKTRDMFLKDL